MAPSRPHWRRRAPFAVAGLASSLSVASPSAASPSVASPSVTGPSITGPSLAGGPPNTASPKLESRRNPERRSWGVGLDAVVGLRQARLDGLSQRLESEGFASLDTTAAQYGFQLGFQWARLRLGLDFSGGSSNSTYLEDRSELGISGIEAGPYLGFDVLRHSGFSLLARAAYLYGALSLNDDAPHLPAFAQSAARQYDLDGVEASYSVFALHFGSEQFVRLYSDDSGDLGLTLGALLGYAWQLHSGAWETRNIHNQDYDGLGVPGGPDLDGAGWRFRLTLGLGAHAF